MSSDIQLYLGNCLEVMQTMGENSVDTIVTDPPYGLSEDVSVEGLSQRVYDALVKISFPNLYERNAESFKGSDFAGVTRDGSDLGIVDGAIGEKTGIVRQTFLRQTLSRVRLPCVSEYGRNTLAFCALDKHTPCFV